MAWQALRRIVWKYGTFSENGMKTTSKTKPGSNGMLGGIIDAPASSSDSETAIELKRIQVKTFAFPIIGVSPLIVHRFSEKARKAIEDKQAKKADGAIKSHEARDPHAEYLASFYLMPGSPKAGSGDAKYGFPATAFKNAAVDACSFVAGMTKVEARGGFHVMDDGGGLVELQYDSVQMRTDAVRVGMGSLDMRYRPEFVGWRCTLRIRYNAAFISPEQIINLFNLSGFAIGIGEWRPQKDGSNGMFEVGIGK